MGSSHAKAPACSPTFGRETVVRKIVIAGALGAFAFLAAGPLLHLGVVPQTFIGDASKASIKAALDFGTDDAWACRGGGKGIGGSKGNNGFGNGGGDGVPGRSGHQDRTR